MLLHQVAAGRVQVMVWSKCLTKVSQRAQGTQCQPPGSAAGLASPQGTGGGPRPM